MKVSVLMPTMNEERGVGVTIDMIDRAAFKKMGLDLEVVIVDADSKDKTQKIAKSKGARVIVEKRRGYGRAYKTGMADVDGDIIVTGDADATYPFDLIQEYVKMLLDEDLDFLTTDRFSQLESGSMSVTHAFGNMTLAWTLKILYLVNLRDSQSGMWIFKREALEKIRRPLDCFDDGMPFSEQIKIEMFSSPMIAAREIPSVLRPREGEVKLESFKDGWRNLKFLFRNRVRPHLK